MSADIMGEGGSDGYGGAGVEMPCVWGDWLPLGRVARKGKTGMTDQILMKRMKPCGMLFLFVKGRVLVRREEFKSGSWLVGALSCCVGSLDLKR